MECLMVAGGARWPGLGGEVVRWEWNGGIIWKLKAFIAIYQALA